MIDVSFLSIHKYRMHLFFSHNILPSLNHGLYACQFHLCEWSLKILLKHSEDFAQTQPPPWNLCVYTSPARRFPVPLHSFFPLIFLYHCPIVVKYPCSCCLPTYCLSHCFMLALLWNRQVGIWKCWRVNPIPRDSDLAGMGCGLGRKVFEIFLGDAAAATTEKVKPLSLEG